MSTERGREMKKWEYKWVRPEELLPHIMESYGRDGWEFAGSIGDDWIIFKRPRAICPPIPNTSHPWKTMDDEGAFVIRARKEIEYRAKSAGFDFDPDYDIVTTTDNETTTVFLFRSRKAVYDAIGSFIGYEYSHLVYLMFDGITSPIEFPESLLNPRIVVICPWLVIQRLPGGTIVDGKHGGRLCTKPILKWREDKL